MARKISARTVVNRKALNAIREGEVAAMERLGQKFLAVAVVPDDPPYGVGLVQTGQYGVWADGKKVAGLAGKPRSVAVKQGVTLLAGFNFPGHLLEFGTIHMASEPFVTPAMLEALPDAEAFIRTEVRAKLSGVR